MALERNADSDGAGRGWRDLEDARLIAGMQQGYLDAFAEMYRRYAPLLNRMARRRKVPDIDRENMIMDYLEDTLIAVLRGERCLPAPLGNYLATGFRRRLISAWRARNTADARLETLEVTSSAPRERVVAEGLSQYAFQAASGSDVVASSETSRGVGCDPIQRAKAGLASALTGAMTDDEQQLMGLVAENFPQREIAASLGIAHSAARVRIYRLRERLTEVAAAYIGNLPVQEGILLARLLDTPRGLRMNGAMRPTAMTHERGSRTDDT